MSTWIALLRGVNVGGNNPLPMKSLLALLTRLGMEDARTYIQSGNVVFRSRAGTAPALAKAIAQAISQEHGFAPKVLVLRAADLERTVAENPYPAAAADPRRHHVYFLSEAPRAPDLAALEALRVGETFALAGARFYLHTPDGLGNSRLAARVEKALGVDATARNWITVTALQEMARAL
jgi:uncharacterized protein (DUF1697 family)